MWEWIRIHILRRQPRTEELPFVEDTPVLGFIAPTRAMATVKQHKHRRKHGRR